MNLMFKGWFVLMEFVGCDVLMFFVLLLLILRFKFSNCWRDLVFVFGSCVFIEIREREVERERGIGVFFDFGVCFYFVFGFFWFF